MRGANGVRQGWHTKEDLKDDLMLVGRVGEAIEKEILRCLLAPVGGVQDGEEVGECLEELLGQHGTQLAGRRGEDETGDELLVEDVAQLLIVFVRSGLAAPVEVAQSRKVDSAPLTREKDDHALRQVELAVAFVAPTVAPLLRGDDLVIW